MRIGIVIQWVSKTDGQGRVAFELAKYALEMGHTVNLIARSVEPVLLELGAIWTQLKPVPIRVELLTVRQLANLATQVLREQCDDFDVIHGFGYSLNVPHHVNSAQFVHSSWLQSPYHTSRLRGGLYGLYHRIFSVMNKKWELEAFLQSRVVVACSELVRKELLEIGVKSDSIRVIENATEPIEAVSDSSDCVGLGLPRGKVYALFVGDIRTPRKNLETVLAALRLVSELHLVVVGETKNSPYPRMAEIMGLKKRVHFLGFRRDIPKVMKEMDIFVFPSRYEPFGLVVLEAMAAGLPIVTAESVGAARLVDRNAGYVLSSSEDVDGIVRALQELMASSVKRSSMGAAGWKIAQNHTWKQMCEQYLRIYDEIVNGIR